jgi:electron transfer flavoprotein beta subunit
MDVVVLAKVVPNPTGDPPEIGPDFRLRRAEADGGLDESDEPSIEIAVRLVDELGGELKVVSMGPEQAVRGLWRALAFGAHRGVLVTDDSLQGADALATAMVLAAAIEREPFDLVLAGVESTDGATGTMPMALAERLGVPCLTFARRLAVESGRVSVERQAEHGHDVLESALPALVTVTAGVAAPRYPSFRKVTQAKEKPLERLTLADLGLGPDDVRPTQHVTAVEIAPERQAGELIEDETEAPARIVELLVEAKVI